MAMGELDIEKLVSYVNTELKKGLSTASVEKKMKVGKDTIRKKLNRAGYNYDKDLNQYVTRDNINNTESITQHNLDNTKSITLNNNVSYKSNESVYNNKNTALEAENLELQKFKELDIEEKINVINNLTIGQKNLKEIEQEIGFTNVGNYIPKNKAFWDGKEKIYKLIEQEGQFTSQEVLVLKELIKNYNVKKEIEKFDIDSLNDKEITTRSFRSYKEVMNKFSEFCKDNNLNQAEAIATALNNFITKNIS